MPERVVRTGKRKAIDLNSDFISMTNLMPTMVQPFNHMVQGWHVHTFAVDIDAISHGAGASLSPAAL
jgi:hypothetical protein